VSLLSFPLHRAENGAILRSIARPLRKIRNGYSLIEVSFVLLILMGLAGMGISAFYYIHNDYVARHESQVLMKLGENLLSVSRSLNKDSSFQYDDSSIQSIWHQYLIEYGAMPEEMICQDNPDGCTNRWGGSIKIIFKGFNDFAVTYSDMPPEICALMVRYIPSGIFKYFGTLWSGGDLGGAMFVISDVITRPEEISGICESGHKIVWSTVYSLYSNP